MRLSPAEADEAVTGGVVEPRTCVAGNVSSFVFFQPFLPQRRFQVRCVGRLEQWNIFKRLAWRNRAAVCVLRKTWGTRGVFVYSRDWK